MKLRFTIRELILVTVIIALVLGWWLDRRQLTDRLAKHEDQIFTFHVGLTR